MSQIDFQMAHFHAGVPQFLFQSHRAVIINPVWLLSIIGLPGGEQNIRTLYRQRTANCCANSVTAAGPGDERELFIKVWITGVIQGTTLQVESNIDAEMQFSRVK